MSQLFQSIAARFARLIDATAAANGAGMVGFGYAMAYGAGTVGAWLKALATATGSTLIGWVQAGAGAVLRTISDKLRESVSVKDFGAVGDGVTDDTAAFVAALATGKNVFVPDTTAAYVVKSTIQLATAYQRLFGNSWLAKIDFKLTAAGPGIATSNATGWQRISGLYINGVSNVTKAISIGSPDCTVEGCYVYNATAGGHGIYLEDENPGTNTYTFDARIIGNQVYGVLAQGTYGIRLGLYHQAARIERNSVQNFGWLLYLNGATTQTTIERNIFQRSDTTGPTPAAIVISKAGSAMPCYGVTIERNYFEQNQVAIYVDDAAIKGLVIRDNYAYRNTASQAGSAFYATGTNTSAGSSGIVIDGNNSDGYAYLLKINNEYAGNFLSVKRNTMNGGVGFSTTTTGNAALPGLGYAFRTFNAYYLRRIISGAFIGEAVNRLEGKSMVYQVPVEWGDGKLDKISFNFITTAGAGVTVELRKVASEGNADTLVASSGLVNAGGIVSFNVGAYADRTYHYYLQVTHDNVGTSSYVYPFRFWLSA